MPTNLQIAAILIVVLLVAGAFSAAHRNKRRIEQGRDREDTPEPPRDRPDL